MPHVDATSTEDNKVSSDKTEKFCLSISAAYDGLILSSYNLRATLSYGLTRVTISHHITIAR